MENGECQQAPRSSNGASWEKSFRPHPLFRGGHAQTIVGSYLPWKATSLCTVTRREVLLDDGDRLILHETSPANWRAGEPAALMLHGLCGSFQSGYMLRVSHKLVDRGVRVFRQDLRGFGAGFDTARGHCHAGRTEDALAGLNFAIDQCPGSPVTLVGFSLGANIVLKLLGELGGCAPAALRRAVAAAPPIDLVHCARNLQKGLNRLYDWSFVSRLNELLGERRRAVKDLIDIELPTRPRRLWEFDDRYTAIVAGYQGAEDYYTQASSGPYLAAIRTPTLLIAAEDDPVVPVAMFDRWPASSAVEKRITRHGGHLGYIGAADSNGADADRRWLDWRIVDWVLGE